MPTESPNSPQLLKGALAVYESDSPGAQPQVIAFQYNPNQLSRELALRTPPRDTKNVGNAKEDVRRVMGPPVETVSLSVELDATDQLEDADNNGLVAENGLYPALASLEMLLYPKAFRIKEMERLAARGEVQVQPADVPLTLLVLDRSRVFPVFLTKFSITEQAFDRNLNPIRAKVDLGMRVLTDMELDSKSEGLKVFRSYQRKKETLATSHRTGQSSSQQAIAASQRIAAMSGRR